MLFLIYFTKVVMGALTLYLASCLINLGMSGRVFRDALMPVWMRSEYISTHQYWAGRMLKTVIAMILVVESSLAFMPQLRYWSTLKVIHICIFAAPLLILSFVLGRKKADGLHWRLHGKFGKFCVYTLGTGTVTTGAALIWLIPVR